MFSKHRSDLKVVPPSTLLYVEESSPPNMRNSSRYVNRFLNYSIDRETSMFFLIFYEYKYIFQASQNNFLVTYRPALDP